MAIAGKSQKKDTSKGGSSKASNSKKEVKKKKGSSSVASSSAAGKKSSLKKAVVSAKKKHSNKGVLALKRYNAVQHILSQYLRENEITSGRSFKDMAHQMYQMTKGYPLKYVQQNIDAIYQQRIHERPKLVTFPDNIEFYHFLATIQLPEYDDVVISYFFNDGVEQFESKGDNSVITADFHSSGLYRYLRANYNGSPPNNAVFVVRSTDNKTFVDYEIRTFNEPKGSGEPSEPPSKGAGTAPGERSPSSATSPSVEQQIALEREKQATEKLRIQTLQEVQKLLDRGFTKDEIMQLLGK